MLHEALINFADKGIINVEVKIDGSAYTQAEPKIISETKDGVIRKYGVFEEVEGMKKEPLLLSIQFDAQRFTTQQAQDYLNQQGITAQWFSEYIPGDWVLSAIHKGKNGHQLKPKFIDLGGSKYQKDVIRVGHYEHPEGNWTLDVTPERMDSWVNTFNAMQENGVDIEVVVDHSTKADDVRGLVTEMYVEGDELIATLSLTEDGEKTVKNVKNVSVQIERDVKDGTGKEYGEAITHIALVQKPVVPGQRDFVPIAASRYAPLMLSIVTPTEQETDMKELNEFIEKLGKRLNLSLVADDAEASIETIAEAMTPAAKDEKPKEPETPDPVVEQMASIGEQRLSLLVEKGKLSPAAKEKALSLLGEKGKRNKIMLSLDADGKCAINDLCEILEANTVVNTDEMKLSMLNNPNDEQCDDTGDCTKEMISMM